MADLLWGVGSGSVVDLDMKHRFWDEMKLRLLLSMLRLMLFRLFGNRLRGFLLFGGVKLYGDSRLLHLLRPLRLLLMTLRSTFFFLNLHRITLTPSSITSSAPSSTSRSTTPHRFFLSDSFSCVIFIQQIFWRRWSWRFSGSTSSGCRYCGYKWLLLFLWDLGWGFADYFFGCFVVLTFLGQIWILRGFMGWGLCVCNLFFWRSAAFFSRRHLRFFRLLYRCLFVVVLYLFWGNELIPLILVNHILWNFLLFWTIPNFHLFLPFLSLCFIPLPRIFPLPSFFPIFLFILATRAD